GEVPERPKGADCKSAGVRLQRFKSSPPHTQDLSARGLAGLFARAILSGESRIRARSGSSSVVERQPSKLRVAGSSPVSRSKPRDFAELGGFSRRSRKLGPA